MSMNPLRLWEPAFIWPFVSIAARYNQDSGDGDKDLRDFIPDTIKTWVPEAKVHTFFDEEKLDFTYAVEFRDGLLICFLGTEGPWYGPGWKSDFSPGVETDEFRKKKGHVDFIKSGELAARHFATIANEFADNLIVGGHSRGARCLAAARYWKERFDITPRHVIPFCGPAVFNHEGADEYDKSGLGGVTIRPVMHHDPVDLMGLPFLKHVGAELKLPDVHSDIIEQKGLAGHAFYGHAYSSVTAAMVQYCFVRNMVPEIGWLKSKSFVDTI